MIALLGKQGDDFINYDIILGAICAVTLLILIPWMFLEMKSKRERFLKANPNASVIKMRAIPKSLGGSIIVRTVDGFKQGVHVLKKLRNEIYILPGKHQIDGVCRYSRWYSNSAYAKKFTYTANIEPNKTYLLVYDWKLKQVVQFEQERID